jgi:cellulose synthase/poly-beta-1,6-N-acetylglucosamine synthase-like glycosyltransferase
MTCLPVERPYRSPGPAAPARRRGDNELVVKEIGRSVDLTVSSGFAGTRTVAVLLVPLFSIVIPTFNRERLIAATLESVLAQTEGDFEVIVVDDGSTDGTEAALAPWRDRLTFVRQPNQGPGPARNLGAARAKGEYIAFLDSDDLWFPWTLAYVR